MKALFLLATMITPVFSVASARIAARGLTENPQHDREPALQTPKWDDPILWNGAIENVLNFFNHSAWDEASGSYASEISENGTPLSDIRHAVSIGRMIYANARAPLNYRDLERARRIADFLRAYMVEHDRYGVRFLPSVHASGEPSLQGRSFVSIFEQVYPIAGLVALYDADPLSNADLKPFIREAVQSFWRRFEDREEGGLYHDYNFVRDDHSNDQGEVKKSYQSTVYPLSSFLLALWESIPDSRKDLEPRIHHLLDLVTQHVVQRKDGRVTGWLNERFARNFAVDQAYQVNESGHLTQVAWVLLRSLSLGLVKDPGKRTEYRNIARTILNKLVEQRGFSAKTQCVYDRFDTDLSLPIRDESGVAASSWWSNLEALIAYSMGMREGLFPTGEGTISRTLEGLTSCYFENFVDRTYGGEYFRINADSGVLLDGTKGTSGKAGYHLVEAYWYLFQNTQTSHIK